MASAVLLIGTPPFANCNGKVRSKLWWCCAEACRATPQLWRAGEVESERLLIAALLVESIVVDMVATLATARAADVAEFAGSRHGRSGLFDDTEHSRNLRSILRESKEVVTATWAARLTSRGNNFVLRRFVGPAHQAYKVSKGFSILRLL